MNENANLNNFNSTSFEEYEHRIQEMNINFSPNGESPKTEENPPPIPPKCSLNSSLDIGSGSLERKKIDIQVAEAAPENYSIPKVQNQNSDKVLEDL